MLHINFADDWIRTEVPLVPDATALPTEPQSPTAQKYFFLLSRRKLSRIFFLAPSCELSILQENIQKIERG